MSDPELEKNRAVLRSLLPRIKDAWNVRHVELERDAILVHADEDHVLNFPDQLHQFPVRVSTEEAA